MPSAVQQSVQSRYESMSAALNATGRPILFSMCDWGVSSPWLYAQTVRNPTNFLSSCIKL